MLGWVKERSTTVAGTWVKRDAWCHWPIALAWERGGVGTRRQGRRRTLAAQAFPRTPDARAPSNGGHRQSQ